MAKTLKEKFIEALTAIGEHEIKQTHKYVVFSCSGGGYYYIGASGALRHGATVAGSIPVNIRAKASLLLSVAVS